VNVCEVWLFFITMIFWLFDDSCSHKVIIEIYKRQIKTNAIFLTHVQQVLLRSCATKEATNS